MTRTPAGVRKLVLLCVVLVMVSCSSKGDDGDKNAKAGDSATETTAEAPPPAGPAPTQEQLDRVKVRWEQITTAAYPTAVAFRGSKMYVAEREGTVRLVKDGKPVEAPAIDLTGDVGTRGEGGLLGLAFSRDGKTMFVHYTDMKADTHVVSFPMAGDEADAGKRHELLFLDQPAPVHNGGGMVVDDKGNLWVAFGDGGNRDERRRVAQDVNSLFGKLVRIDPRPDGDKPYRIPEGNAFPGRADARPEVYAYGLRNPWRFSIDRSTGDVWIGDVGEHGAEEVDYIPSGKAGVNFGWPAFEGTKRFQTSEQAPGHVPPIKNIARVGKVCAVTGGYVYRGKAIPDLQGAYVYGDVCTGNVSLLSQDGGKIVAEREMGPLWDQLVSFGEDPSGELYAMSLVGQVWKLVPA